MSGRLALGVEVRGLQAGDEVGVREVMEAALPVDRIPGYTRYDIDRTIVRMVPDPGGTVVALEDGRIVGYCVLLADDLTVHPGFRRRGHGRRLLQAAGEVARRRGREALQLYVPPHLPGSVAFAMAVGLGYRSSLWRFELPADRPVPPPAFPPGVTTRPFEAAREGNVESWVDFMLAAFEGHPTPMTWTPAVIAHVNASPDFDPTGILIVAAADAPDERIAFARVETSVDDAGVLTGDIGLIGVLPGWRRHGLGRELLRWAVTELRRRGATVVELSVEATNERATALYRAHGFEPAIEWPHWILPVD